MSSSTTIPKFLPTLRRHSSIDEYVHTRSLVEVYQIFIDKFDDVERRGELYGDIQVVDLERGPLTLYHRDRAIAEHIRANRNISLTGPPRSISQVTGFAVNIDLRLCGDVKDVSVFKWQLSWDALKPEVAHITRGPFLPDFSDDPNMLLSQTSDNHQSAGYDQPLSAVFEGPNGCCITMYYAIFLHAVQAWVEVEIVHLYVHPNSAKFEVCGSIFASPSRFARGNDSVIKNECKTTLLKTGDLESIKAACWKPFQLSRCMIAVPAYSPLVIEADLWDTNSSLKIAKGKLEFLPQSKGLIYDHIRGDNDFALRVKVSWTYGSRIPRSHFPFPG